MRSTVGVGVVRQPRFSRSSLGPLQQMQAVDGLGDQYGCGDCGLRRVVEAAQLFQASRGNLPAPAARHLPAVLLLAVSQQPADPIIQLGLVGHERHQGADAHQVVESKLP